MKMTGKRSRNSSENSYDSSDDEFHDQEKSMGENSNGESRGRACKRGRAPSKRPCLNKNALMARQNRQKKKEYMESLEKELREIRRENRSQFDIIQQQKIDLKRLSAENSYLRSALKNKSTITSLLTSMNTVLSKGKSKKTNQCDVNDNKMAVSRNISKKSSESEINSIFNQQTVDSQINYQGDDDMKIDHSSTNSESFPDVDLLNAADLSLPDIDFNKIDSKDLFDCLSEAESDLLPDDSINPANLFESLEDTGICLHVTSGKVSMEFCTACHVNCINSDEPA